MRNVSCINLDIFFNLMQVANSSTFLVMIVKPGLGYSPVKTILLFWEHYDFMNTKIDYILLLTLGFFSVCDIQVNKSQVLAQNLSAWIAASQKGFTFPKNADYRPSKQRGLQRRTKCCT